MIESAANVKLYRLARRLLVEQKVVAVLTESLLDWTGIGVESSVP